MKLYSGLLIHFCLFTGSFYCLSIGKDASIENVVTVTSQDGFTLVLDSQSYHSLGIQGRQFRRVSGDSAHCKLLGDTNSLNLLRDIYLFQIDCNFQENAEC